LSEPCYQRKELDNTEKIKKQKRKNQRHCKELPFHKGWGGSSWKSKRYCEQEGWREACNDLRSPYRGNQVV